ncbi:MAG: cobyrinic acid a,c-diamide synthase, partial [Octadecabacter sp.]
MGGLIFAAPASGSGKTTITLGFLCAAVRMGAQIRSAKSGPDYIDPRFHEAASGAPCLNLDAWAMTPDRLHSLAAGDGDLIIEGAMGL